MEKLTIKEQAQGRSDIYGLTGNMLSQFDYEQEQIADGLLVKDIETGAYYKLKVSYCNPEKFDLDKEREKYQEKEARRRERIAKAKGSKA